MSEVKESISAMRKQGLSFGAISKALNDRGLKTKSGLVWTAGRTAATFQNIERRRSKKRVAKTAAPQTASADFFLNLVRQVHGSNQAKAVKQNLITAIANAYVGN